VLHNKVSMDCERILYQVLQLLLRMVQQQRHAELQTTAACFKTLVADGKDKNKTIIHEPTVLESGQQQNITETEELKEMIDQVHRETNLSNFEYVDARNDPKSSDDDSDDGLSEELDLSSDVEDGEMLYEEDQARQLSHIFKLFVVTAMFETNLSHDDYINAHHNTTVTESDDDGMAEELTNLRCVEEELGRELSKSEFEFPKTPDVPTQHRRVIPEDFGGMDDKKAMHTVYQAMLAMSSDSDSFEESCSSQETESTFDASAARRAVQEALLNMPSVPSGNMGMHLPIIEPVLGKGSTLWSHQSSIYSEQPHFPEKESESEEEDYMISLYTQPSASDLSPCAGSASVRTVQSVNFFHDQADSIFYDDFPSLLSVDSVSVEECPRRGNDEPSSILLRLKAASSSAESNFPEAIPVTDNECYECIPQTSCGLFPGHQEAPRGQLLLLEQEKASSQFAQIATGVNWRLPVNVERKQILSLPTGAFEPVRRRDEQATGTCESKPDSDVPAEAFFNHEKPIIPKEPGWSKEEVDRTTHRRVSFQEQVEEEDDASSVPLAELQVGRTSPDDTDIVSPNGGVCESLAKEAWNRGFGDNDSIESEKYRYFTSTGPDPMYLSFMSIHQSASAEGNQTPAEHFWGSESFSQQQSHDC
jgi:hypothetical protein